MRLRSKRFLCTFVMGNLSSDVTECTEEVLANVDEWYIVQDFGRGKYSKTTTRVLFQNIIISYEKTNNSYHS